MGERMKKRRKAYLAFAPFLAVVLGLALASSASAKLTGNYTKFAQCPYPNTEVKKCIYSVTESGEVVLGSKKVPIVNPVTLQGGVGAVGEDEFGQFFAASNGVTLSKSPQPVPGGLAGLVNCKEISNVLLRLSCEAALENGVTGVDSTLELAGPASEIRVSENHLAGETGTALELPVKIHLENPFLGSNCYVGSSSSPIIWPLTSGETSPPGPNKPIHGSVGIFEFFEEGRILEDKEAILVENAWSAPGATGCGGPLVELLLDPVVNVSGGLPAAAGKNTAILVNTINVASAVAVRKNNAENP
jgi:hypothetical protein